MKTERQINVDCVTAGYLLPALGITKVSYQQDKD
jgi:hypothetical protein